MLNNNLTSSGGSSSAAANNNTHNHGPLTMAQEAHAKTSSLEDTLRELIDLSLSDHPVHQPTNAPNASSTNLLSSTQHPSSTSPSTSYTTTAAPVSASASAATPSSPAFGMAPIASHHSSAHSSLSSLHRHWSADGDDSDSGADNQGGLDRHDTDNISLGSVYTTTSTLPPTYDLAEILAAHGRPVGADSTPNNSTATTTAATNTIANNNNNNNNNNHSNGNRILGGRRGTGVNGTLPLPTSRIPLNLPSTQEMENMPNDVVALILETLTILELFDLYTLSERWRQLTSRALLDKFTLSNVVLWIDQESHRTFRPVFLFDSFDEATNRIRWLPKFQPKVEDRGQVYSKTFGITKPTVRIISVGEVDTYDYLDKEAHVSIHRPGTRTLLGTDQGCPWAFIYKVSKFTRKGKRVQGERWIEPVSFECHLNFLNPRRAHRLRLLWYLQKSYAGVVPSVIHNNGGSLGANSSGNKARRMTNPRTKVEGALPTREINTYFQQHHQHIVPPPKPPHLQQELEAELGR